MLFAPYPYINFKLEDFIFYKLSDFHRNHYFLSTRKVTCNRNGKSLGLGLLDLDIPVAINS